MSARKMRLVADNIRSKRVNDAFGLLRYTRNEAADWLYKVLASAIANWEYKLDGSESADDYDLYVKFITVDQGPFLKRFRPAPHGRATRIHKHTNHVTIVVENLRPLDIDNLANDDTEDGDEVAHNEVEGQSGDTE